MKAKNFLFPLVLLFTGFNGISQQSKERNTKIAIPDIPGYMSLTADFHLHTVFSDGHVWPSYRVREAQRDGLDVISLTEHIDYEGFPDELDYNRERAFEIAQEAAENTNVLVIRGIEISPRVPPYHNNALFLKDVDAFPYDYMKETHQEFIMKTEIEREELMAPFLEVEAQGGFVFYNHPNYNWWDGKDRELFTDIHQELLSKGILGGVEVANSGRYNVIAHRMAEKYDLTMFSNSDAHYDVAANYEGSHRPMTIIFATEKTPEAIQEALEAKRTLAYFGNYLVGRQKEAEAFFKAALEIEVEEIKGKNAPKVRVNLTNTSQIPFQIKISSDFIIEDLPLGRLELEAGKTTKIILYPVWEVPKELLLDILVENILVSPEKGLETVLRIPTANNSKN